MHDQVRDNDMHFPLELLIIQYVSMAAKNTYWSDNALAIGIGFFF